MIMLVAILAERWTLSTYERITTRHNWPNKNASYVFEANRFIKNRDILMCLDVTAREYGGEVVDKN